VYSCRVCQHMQGVYLNRMRVCEQGSIGRVGGWVYGEGVGVGGGGGGLLVSTKSGVSEKTEDLSIRVIAAHCYK
jgi:hypothetical protein